MSPSVAVALSGLLTLLSRSSVFLSNLSFKATEEDIRAFFETFATVTSVRIVKNPRGISKGFAYVDLGDEVRFRRPPYRPPSSSLLFFLLLAIQLVTTVI